MPIESIFIVDNYLLNEQNIFNLIGRANRLNDVFNEVFAPKKLLVPVHLIESKYSTYTMKNKLEKFRDTNFKNKIENPLLDFNTKTDKNDVKIYEDNYLNSLSKNETTLLQKIMMSTGLYNAYKDFNKSIEIINNNISSINSLITNNFSKIECILQKMHYIFFKGFEYNDFKDYEIARLINSSTIQYYTNYVEHRYHIGLKQKIESFMREFRFKQKNNNPLKYVGTSYGEMENVTPFYNSGGKKVIVNLKDKNNDQLVNLAIVLSKIEDDYVSIHIERFIEALLKLELISENEYNYFIYGTDDMKEIELKKIGFSLVLLNFLKDNNLIKLINIEPNGIYSCHKDLIVEIENADELIKFEFYKYFS